MNEAEASKNEFDIPESMTDPGEEIWTQHLKQDILWLQEKSSGDMVGSRISDDSGREVQGLKKLFQEELPGQKAQLETERKKLLDIIAGEEAAVTLLRQSIENCERTREAMKERFVALKREKENSNTEIYAMQDAIAAMAQELEVNKQKKTKLRESLLHRRQELQEASQQYARYEEEMDELNRQNAALVEREKALPEKLKILSQSRLSIEERESSLSSKEEECSALEGRLLQEKEMLDQRRQKIEETQRRCDLLQAEVDDLKSLCSGDYEENEKRLLEQKAMYEKIANDSDSRLRSLNLEMEAQRQQLAEKAETLRRLQEERENLSADIRNQGDRITENLQALERLREKWKEQEAECQDADNQYREDTQRLEAIAKRKADLELARGELLKKIQKEAAAFNQNFSPHIEEEMKGMQKRLDILGHACEELRREFESEESARSSAEEISNCIRKLRQQLELTRNTYKTILNTLEIR